MDERKARRTRAAKGMTPAASRWQALIADWARGRLTQRAYCRRMRISASTFAWWKHQLAGAASSTAPAGRRGSTPPRFVPVTVLPTDAPALGPPPEATSAEDDRTSTPTDSVPLEIIFSGDIRVRVGAACDGALLGRVLAALRGAGC
jgi:hypothetical protein